MSLGTIAASIVIVGVTLLLNLRDKQYEEEKEVFENEK